MLASLRRNRRLTAMVLSAFVLVLLVAMLASAQTRKALHPVDICTSVGSGATAVLHAGHDGHDGFGGADQALPDHHADPSCVLCLALTTPPEMPAWGYQPPSPHAFVLWWAAQAPRAQRPSASPPPLRGPPDRAMV